MLKVTLETPTLTVELDEISQNGKGVEVIAGLVGFGLPPLDVQWAEGASDGATHRYTRVLPRDVDLPLHVVADDRAGLKADIARISKLFAGKVTVKVYETDDDTFVYADFHRVSGGSYTYGVDTIGETEFNTVITMRAGSPFWKHGAAEQASVTAVTPINTQLVVDNPGSHKARPTWVIRGAASEVRLTSPSGELLTWSGRLNTEDILTIDTEAGTVKDQTGANRYGGLGIAPVMFDIPADASSCGIEVYNVAPSSVRTNYAAYGSFRHATLHGFTIANAGAVTTGAGALNVPPGPTDVVTTRATATTTISGLPVGEVVQIRCKMTPIGGAPNLKPMAANLAGRVFESTSSAPLDMAFEFVVPASGSVVLAFRGGWGSVGTKQSDRGFALSGLFIGSPGAYFDGSTANSAGVTHAWSGTTYASVSTRTQAGAGSPSSVTVELNYEPRDWMVV